MNVQEVVNSMFEKIMSDDRRLSEILNKQHYHFAHKLIPYIVDNSFSKVLNSFTDETTEDLISQLWNDFCNNPIPKYNLAVHPRFYLAKSEVFEELELEDLGLIYFVMPAPRKPTEALYGAIVFMIDNDIPSSEWTRSYFTLELGLGELPYWMLGKWEDGRHGSIRELELEPTLGNFLVAVIGEAKRRWF